MMGYALRTDRFRLVRWQDRNNPGKIIDVELYDHQQDKSESVNVANQAEYKTIVTTLNQQLDAALAKQVRGKYPRTE